MGAILAGITILSMIAVACHGAARHPWLGAACAAFLMQHSAPHLDTSFAGIVFAALFGVGVLIALATTYGFVRGPTEPAPPEPPLPIARLRA